MRQARGVEEQEAGHVGPERVEFVPFEAQGEARVPSADGTDSYAISTGGGTYPLRIVPAGVMLLLRSHGWASSPRSQSLA